MVRRSLWFGLRLGLLLGVGFAVFKTLQSRRSGRHPITEPWQPIVDTPRPTPAPAPPPVRRPVDEVGEPITEPAPPPPPEPAAERPEPATPAERPEPAVAATPVDTATTRAAKATKATKKADKANKTAEKANKAAKAEKATKKADKAAKKAPSQATAMAAWVDPDEGVCPPSHPVKAKLASRLFHLPGMLAYARTKPDRCYRDADAALADGFTQSRR